MSASDSTEAKGDAPCPEHIKQWQDWSTCFNPSTLEPLLPVKELIFDILELEIPTTMIRVSKELYDKIIPGLYFEIHLSDERIDRLMYGLLHPIEGSDSANGNGDDDQYHLGIRKKKAFEHVEYLVIFPLLKDMATAYTFCRRSFVHALNHPLVMRLPEIIGRHAKAKSTCLVWPLLWERPEELFDPENDDDIFEPTIAIAMQATMQRLKQKAGFDKVRIHIRAFDLQEASTYEPEDDSSPEIVYDIIPQPSLSAEDLFNALFDHDLWGTVKENVNVRLRYLVPQLQGYQEELEREGDLAKHHLDGKAAVIDDETSCPCGI
ncbi:hypothetical protein I316_03478 [Kwoniella heveanensis BCC8398]|uniref:Uncharacterized protein n=1 Tax=Kwoniella heveanensis BCC8398 TaxID=1296120 RepID=A0A1B9GV63_9TREE|nr:hypothetical protein I316_03478 [Kwoniella heveanensis BCC8398]